jgi:uncharacterized protein (TIGR02996 family)
MAFYPHIQAPRPEVRVFLEDIRSRPDDDAPRLILADWLDDYGDETDRARAELIRVQCALARSGRSPAPLRERERELLHEHAESWLGPLAKMAEEFCFDRGMLRLVLHGQRCFSPELAELAPTETYAWVADLTLVQLTGAAVHRLVQLPILAGARSLTVDDARLGDQGLGLLATSSHLGQLRELHLGNCNIRDGGLRALAGSNRLSRLETLDLPRNHIRDAVAALGQSPYFPALTALGLDFNDLTNQALQALTGSPLMTRLQELRLSGNRELGEPGLATLADCPHAGSLRRLDLGKIDLTCEAVRVLALSNRLDGLVHLHLAHSNLDNRAVKEIAFSAGLPRLRNLYLGRNRLTDSGATALMAAPQPRRLHVLELGRNHVGTDTARAIAACPAMTELEELNLEDNRIGDDGALALASSPYLGRLRLLEIGNNGLTALGKAVLLRRFGRDVVLV